MGITAASTCDGSRRASRFARRAKSRGVRLRRGACRTWGPPVRRTWSPNPGGFPPGRSAAGKEPIRWGRIVTVILLLAAPSLVGAVVASAGATMHLRSTAVVEGRAPGELRFV